VEWLCNLRCCQLRSSQFKLPLRHLEPGSTPSLYPLSSTQWGSPSAPASSQFDTARIGGVVLGGYKRQPLKRVPNEEVRDDIRFPCPSILSLLIPHSSFPHSSFLISSFLIPHFLIPHSSFLIPHSSFLIPHSSFLIPHSSFLITWRLLNLVTGLNSPSLL
jgi:hypothetical protein